MEALIEFGKIILPAGAVLYAVFLTVRMFLTKDLEKRLLELKMKNSETVLPIRLQAFERICLFLERISPNNLIMRVNDDEYKSGQFQQILLHEIREEYNHNLSQQVYMADETWDLVKNAMEEIVMIINEAAGAVDQDSKSIELAKKIFQVTMSREKQAVDYALQTLKEEIRLVF
ncbi:hypothetical protein [Reichenbachiella sp. MALMAid0571]|uniref:DUF7935 family protein n=1 Tax=Reichenbachiella sp. MALMAid0571 TaxID=3143939 RepID=UPI0032DE95E5